jgi:predicted phage tail protein
MLVVAETDRFPCTREQTVNFTNHLRRSILAAVATTVVVGAAGTAQAHNTPQVTPLSVAAAPATAAAQAPTPNGALVAAVTAPTAPRSLIAKAGNHKVKLAWLAPSSNGGQPINKYAVQRARPGGPWKTIASPTIRHYTATGLTNGARYYFRVRAHTAAGWGPFSTAVKAIPRTVPTAPRSPTATAGNATVKLAWLAPSSSGGKPINKYAVQRSTSAGGPWKNIAYPTTRSHPATGLTNGTRYYFRIRAHNTAGWSKPSTVVNAVPRTVPTVPQWPSALAGNATVTLSWSTPSSTGGAEIDNFRVQEAPNAGGPWTDVITTHALTYPATGLSNGTHYYFRIAAHNAVGWGPPTTVVTAVPVTVPTAPQALTATSGKDWVHLTWNAPSSDGGSPVDYYVQRAPSAGGPWTALVNTTTISYTNSPLPAGTAYYYRIVAHNAAGFSAPSTPVYANVPTLPGQPSIVQASQLYGKGSDWVRVEWTPPVSDGGAPILNYTIQIRNLAWDKVYKSALEVGNATRTDIYMPADIGSDNVQNGKHYYAVLIAASNAAGLGQWGGGNWLVMEP